MPRKSKPKRPRRAAPNGATVCFNHAALVAPGQSPEITGPLLLEGLSPAHARELCRYVDQLVRQLKRRAAFAWADGWDAKGRPRNAVRNARIRADYETCTAAELAAMHGLTERHVRNILAAGKNVKSATS